MPGEKVAQVPCNCCLHPKVAGTLSGVLSDSFSANFPKNHSRERKPKQDLIVWFLEEAAKLSPEARASWPFTAAKQGQVTISKHIDKVLERHPDRARAVLGGPEATRKARAGDGTNRPAFRPFQRVECDAYKTDTRCVVLVPSHAGGWEPVLVHRIWVIVILEVSARCVLGYAVSVRREPSADDVLRAMKCALTQWSPRKLSFSDVAYVPGGGLPSFLGSKYCGACWDEFSVDGALANICPRVEKPMDDTVDARIIKPQDPNAYSSRRSLDDRPFIETFFRKFRQLHKLSPSTGSKPADRRYRKPEAAAQETFFQLEYLEDLLDVVISNYNATPHTGLGMRSPLRQLEYLCSKPDVLVRQADPGEVRRLLCPRKRCIVHASEVSKTGAYVNFFNARYSAQWLRNRMDLAGDYVWIYLEDDMDARYVTASTLSGTILGGLKALPPWHLSPHTLYMRSAIRSLDSRKIIHLSKYVDPIHELVRAAEENPDKKLAAHPAYLESRRVFAAFANRMQADWESTDHVKRVFSKDPPTSGNIVEKVQTKRPDIATPREGSDSSPVVGRLPPRRKGINLGR